MAGRFERKDNIVNLGYISMRPKDIKVYFEILSLFLPPICQESSQIPRHQQSERTRRPSRPLPRLLIFFLFTLLFKRQVQKLLSLCFITAVIKNTLSFLPEIATLLTLI